MMSKSLVNQTMNTNKSIGFAFDCKLLIEQDSIIATIQLTVTAKTRERKILTTPNCSDAFAFQSLRLVSSLPEIT